MVRLKEGEDYYGPTRYGSPSTVVAESHFVEGGAATVVDLPLDPERRLVSLTWRARANEIVAGLLGLTLVRPASD